MNYCMNAACGMHICNGSWGIAAFRLLVALLLLCIVNSGLFPSSSRPQPIHFSFRSIRLSSVVVQVQWHHGEAAFGTFGRVGRCQVLLENKISISTHSVSSLFWCTDYRLSLLFVKPDWVVIFFAGAPFPNTFALHSISFVYAQMKHVLNDMLV